MRSYLFLRSSSVHSFRQYNLSSYDFPFILLIIFVNLLWTFSVGGGDPLPHPPPAWLGAYTPCAGAQAPPLLGPRSRKPFPQIKIFHYTPDLYRHNIRPTLMSLNLIVLLIMPNSLVALLQAYIYCLEHFISPDIHHLNPFHNLQQITLCLQVLHILPVT